MAKITQYPAKTVPSNNDEFVLHDTAAGSTKKMTRGDLIGGAPLPANTVDGQAIANGSVGKSKLDFDSGVWWEEVGRAKLSSSSSILTATLTSPKKFLNILIFVSGQSNANVTPALRFNGDSGSNYAYRGANDGTGLSSVTNANFIGVGNADNWPATRTLTIDVSSVSSRTKSVTFLESGAMASATVVPSTRTGFGMWSNTTANITSVSLLTTNSNTWNAETEIVVLGHN